MLVAQLAAGAAAVAAVLFLALWRESRRLDRVDAAELAVEQRGAE